MLLKLEKLCKNWTKPRVFYWISWLFAPFFGRHLFCRVCGKDFGKILPIFWSNRLALLGLQKNRVCIATCGVSELEFECAEHSPLPEGAKQLHPEGLSDAKPASPRVLHVFLAHQSASYIKKYTEYHQDLLGEDDALLLVYGGPEAAFASISLERKVFCADPRLRGIGYFQSYSDVLRRAWDWCKEHGEHWDYLYFTEGDHWGLVDGYAKIVPGMLQKTGAHFAGHGLIKIENSNDWFLCNAREKDAFDLRLQRIANGRRAEYLHSLGTGLAMRWEVLGDFCSLEHDEQACFLEIYIPSVLASRGWTGMNVNANSEAYSHVRFRPLFSEQEFEQAKAAGIPFIHPYKVEGN